MKKSFITSILIFCITCHSITCFASDDFNYGINETTDISFNNKSTRYDNTTTTIDFVPLFNRSIIVPIKKNISALIRNFCKMCSSTYDMAAVYLASNCGENSNYTMTVSGSNYSLSVLAADGRIGITNIPEGEFSAYIENNDDTDLTCNTNLLGYGLDTTPEEGYHINLTCYDKLPDGKKTNMWAWLGPVVGVVGAAAIGGGAYGIHAANNGGGDDIVP